MSRKSRESFCSIFFHNLVQGINKEYIFNNQREKIKYINLLNDVKLENIKIISYTIMGNHAHILLYVKDIHSMSNFMKNVNQNFASYYNFINKRVGVVFRNRFKTQEILSRNHLYKCIKYIYNNPVKANIVKNIEDYPYSNYKQFIEEDLLSEILDGSSIINDDDLIRTQEILDKEYFIDTKEDVYCYAKGVFKEYLENRNSHNEQSLKLLLNEARREFNISYSYLSEILEIPKTTIWELLKDKNDKII